MAILQEQSSLFIIRMACSVGPDPRPTSVIIAQRRSPDRRKICISSDPRGFLEENNNIP